MSGIPSHTRNFKRPQKPGWEMSSVSGDKLEQGEKRTMANKCGAPRLHIVPKWLLRECRWEGGMEPTSCAKRLTGIDVFNLLVHYVVIFCSGISALNAYDRPRVASKEKLLQSLLSGGWGA